jgi:hypothetical protein
MARRLCSLPSGAVRPFVGAAFGMALTALVLGGVLSFVEVPRSELAFFAALGFLAGFNERFAQDMLAASSGSAGAHETPQNRERGALSSLGNAVAAAPSS